MKRLNKKATVREYALRNERKKRRFCDFCLEGETLRATGNVGGNCERCGVVNGVNYFEH